VLDFQKFFSCSRDIGFITDLHGAVLAVTAGTERALGYSQAELTGLDVSGLDEAGNLRRFFESEIAQSRMSLSFHLRTRAGNVLSVGAMASSLRDESEAPIGWFIAGQDLRGAVAEARGMQPILDALVDSIGAALWSFDRNGTVITWGRACESAFGLSRDDAEGKFSVAQLFPSPEEYRRVLLAVDEAGHFSGELALVGRDGIARPNQVSVTPLVSGGLSVGYTCVSFDVAERKRAEEFQRSLFEQAGEAIVVVDSESRRFIDANAKAWEIHGYTREEFLRLTVEQIVAVPDRELVERVARSLQETGRYESDRHNSLRKDGSVFPCAMNVRSVSVGGRRYSIGVYRDLTEQRKAEEFFRVLFERASDAVYLVEDGTLRIVEANEATARLFGYSREELLRLKVPDLVPPEFRSRIAAVRQSVKDEPGYRRDRRVYLRKDGTTVATDNAISRVQISGKAYYIASSRDLTEQERAGRELEEAKAFLEHVQENASDGFALLDENGAYVTVNRRLLEMNGRRREDMIGTFWVDRTDPQRLEDYRRYWELLMKGQRITMRTAIERPSGPPVEVAVSSALIERGGRRFVFAIIRDVTEQVKAEEELRRSREDLERHVAARTGELRESEGRFRSITESTPLAVTITRPDGEILYHNEATTRLFVLDENGAVGRNAADFYANPSDRQIMRDRILREGKVEGYELRLRKTDGTAFWTVVHLRLMTFQGGAAILGTFLDIDARKKAEELLQKAHEELERRVAERTSELARANRLLQDEIAERRRAENALRLVIEGTSAVTGGSFFRSLVRHLASALNVRYVVVVQNPVRPGAPARTIARWAGDDFGSPLEYDLKGTPCEDVMAGEACSYAHDAQRLFPEARILADLGVESYLGVPMLDSGGKVVGLLSVMHDQPVSDEERKLSVLKIFAARAGVELERQLAEEALRESEERWRSLVANAPDFILTVDRQDRILSINRGVPGISVEEILGRQVFDFMPPDAREQVQQALEKVFREGKPQAYETRAVGPNGTVAWYATRVGPVVIGNEVVGATFIATDITERRKAEQRLKVQHDMTQLLAEAASLEEAVPRILRQVCQGLDWQVGILWKTDPATGLLRFAEAWTGPIPAHREFAESCRSLTFGAGAGAPGRVLKERALLWTSDVQQDSEFARAPSAVRAGLHASLAFPVDGPSGPFGVLEFFNQEPRTAEEPLLSMASTLGSQIGQFIERKRAQEDLLFQKSLLESQSEAAIDGILVVSREGVMTSFNRRFCQMWEIPEEVLRSRTDERALQSVLDKLQDPKEFLDRVRYLYDHPDDESRDEVHLKDGRVFDRYSAPVKGIEGVLYGRVWYFRDVTGRKQTEENLRRAAQETRRAYEELKEAQAQLIRSEKLASIGMLVSGVAHEINNPLNVMYGNLQLLAEVSDVLLPLSVEGARAKKVRGTVGRVSKFRGMIRDALKAARHAREIVQDFRNFARDTRTAELVDLNRCLEEAVTLIQRELKPGIRVVWKLGRIPQVRCLRGQMSQVFLNLLKNAGEAIEKKGTITIRSQKKDGRVIVEVADTGRGMAEEVRSKLFEPFFTTKPVGKGLGLGLSISAMIVQNHNGRISARSQVGRGSVFRVELPLTS
jgi:PAS domain S-box-containing protein